MSDYGLWVAILSLVLGFIVAIIGAAVKFQQSADNSEKNRQAIEMYAAHSKEAIEDIHRRKAVMNTAIAQVSQSLADFRAYVAATYAPMAALEKMETRIMAGLASIERRLDRRTDDTE